MDCDGCHSNHGLSVCYFHLIFIVGLQAEVVRPEARVVYHRVVRRQLVRCLRPARKLYRGADEGSAGGTLHDGGADAEPGQRSNHIRHGEYP